ncbi:MULTISPECIES: B12-binding domain-containing radical SAM protein [Thermoanaerobacterium]|uniref:Radical SAM protein n=2 Tax=Thermoanaerobacterium TaxID=28895 RepID=W9EF80_9THEO|nr:MULTISPECIES: B12-binding domain-containing radical SAM protein [Thermoanaerobacterium]AFK86606.1 Radical SAM domain protein [Thermoanaerobacterium saccharolyticum JW/SL-YS485]ETO38379.1 radical SAM protein [Thermoanaerobacterium aotearoense SCUT27]
MKTLLVALNAKYYHTNLAIRNIKLYCRPMDIELLEMTINDDLDLILHEILNKRPNLIGFSCYIWNIDKVLKLCEYIKKINKDVLIVLGGPEVSYDSDDLLKIGVADFIVLGEGEATFKNLLQRIHNGENVCDLNGISYMNDGKVISRENTDYVCLDDIPFPYDGEDISNKLVYYETSRGCPFRCSYCLSSLDNKLRYASIEKVRDDLEKLTSMGAKIVKLIDRSFDSNIKRAVEILDIIRELRCDTVFHCEVNPELVNQEFIDSLKGIEDKVQFEVGIQTTNKETLKNVSRNPDVSSALKGIKLIINAGVKVHVDLIAGLPGDDFNSIVKSFNDVYELNPDEIQLGFLKLLKGSSLRKNKDIYGIRYRSDPPYEVLMTNTISYMELHELKNIAFLVDKYYNSGKFKMSLRFLLDFFKEPFKLYKRLNYFWVKNGFYGKKHSLNDLFDIIYRFASLEGIDVEYFKDCLRYDYMYFTNNKAYPDCLKEDKKIPDEVKSLLRDDEWLKCNLPSAVGMSNSEKNRNLSIGFFRHDVLNMEEGNVYMAFLHCDNKTYCVKINV